MDNNIKSVVCRKCGGPHFTIKCGKEKKVEEPIVKSLENNKKNDITIENEPCEKVKTISQATLDKKSKIFLSNEINKNKQNYNRPVFKNRYKVKIAELPLDMTNEEMMELTFDWGYILNIKVLNYEDKSVAYIDFGYEDQADYFVKALDKTPFDYLLLNVSRI